MGTYCEHLNTPDGGENTIFESCSKCKMHSFKSHTENVNVHSLLLDGLDDTFDSPEDSPLLIRDDFGQLRLTSEEFHCHKNYNELQGSTAYKKLLWVSILCFCFILIELIGGYFAGSLAILTDAAHLFSDLVGFLISIVAISVGKWAATNSMTFGYHRAEVLGAFLSVITVWILEAAFSIVAIQRLWTMRFDIDVNTMLLVASLGVFINLLMGAVLHGACHSHTLSVPEHTFYHHGHTHGDHNNINIRAAAAHITGDILQSLGVLVAAILIKIFPEWKVADPICTLIFAVVAVCVTFRVVRDSALILLEANTGNSNELGLALRHVEGVRHLHSLHLWTLAPGRDAVAVHLAVDEDCDRDVVLKEATEIIESKVDAVSCTVQIELYNSKLVQDCPKCQSVF